MNKKKIIIFSVVFLGIIFLIFDFLSYRVSKLVKNLIINQGSQTLGQQVSVGQIDTSIVGSSIKISNREVKDNVSSFKPATKNIVSLSAKTSDSSKEQENSEQSKKKNKDFLVNQLTINNSIINASSEFLDIKKDINLSKMSFNNVGTVEQATKFKEVLQMIFSNVLLNINNEIIQGDLKNKIKDKLKNLRNKISPESLKKLERTFR